MPLLEVKNLLKEFKLRQSKKVVHAVTDVSFTLESGTTLGLVGESGSGKTTTGRCILNLIDHTGGDIFFKGTNLSNLRKKEIRKLRPAMQMVFQEPFESLDPRMKLSQIIEEPLKLWGKMSKREIQKRVLELSNMVGIPSASLMNYPHQVSGGMQQKTGIARALATKPDLIVFDEPTSNLNPSAHAEIIELLVRLQKELNIGYIFISHDLTAVQHVSHTIAIMYLSRIIEMGTVEEIFANPTHPYTRALLGSVLFPDPQKKLPPFSLTGEIPSPIDLPSGCYFYSRCTEASERCKMRYPSFHDFSTTHKVACFQYAVEKEHKQAQ